MTESRKCEFCGAGVSVGASVCPRCGASQGDAAAIPPPSPYYQEVIPPEPPTAPTAADPVSPVTPPTTADDALQQAADLTRQAGAAASAVISKEKLAVIALIIGILGIPLALLTGGCSLVGNMVGIWLARLARNSSRRKMAAVALALNIATLVGIGIFFTWIVQELLKTT